MDTSAGHWRFPVVAILMSAGILVSGYLMYIHISHQLGSAGGNLCRMLFGGGCDEALQSSFSSLFGIPLAAWGVIYYISLSLILLLKRLGPIQGESAIPPSAVILSFLAATAGIALSAMMIVGWTTFCPLCAVTHAINLTLAVLLFHLHGKRLNVLISQTFRRVGAFFTETERLSDARRVSVGSYLVVLLVAVSLFEWVYIVEQDLKAAAMDIDEQGIVMDFHRQEELNIPIHPDDAVLGDSAALMKVVIFSDFQCPACRDLAKEMLKLKHLFGEDACLVFKHLPLGKDCIPEMENDIHPRACAAARAAEAARLQGRFWPFHDQLFREGVGESDHDLLQLALRTGLDSTYFTREFTTAEIPDVVRASVDLARKLQVSGTPALFINGRQVRDSRSKAVHFLLEYMLQTTTLMKPVPPITLPRQ